MNNESTIEVEALLARITWDEKGLVPAVVQDVQSKEMLMLAYMNSESLQKTVETGQTWFYSRSRQGLWNKGATSGHVQKVVELHYDCDADTILVKVEQTGPACHTGKYSCFHMPVILPIQSSNVELQAEGYGNTYMQTHGARKESVSEPANSVSYLYQSKHRYGILSELEQTIAERDAERPEGAYTTYLFDKGVDKILKKIAEEAGEVLIAAKNRDLSELRYEVSDLLFHLLVLLREQQLPFDEVLKELAARHLKRK
jgi:phosphoribosyl-ATP pyrophosphohydrolase/phosphoribosyl-AMP cyclohydrolase